MYLHINELYGSVNGMPWRTEWTTPEVFLHYNGVTVYHTYKDNEIRHPLTFSYTTDPDYMEDFSDEGDRFCFDVRDLEFPEPDDAHRIMQTLALESTGEIEPIADIVRRAIDIGVIIVPDDA